MDRHAASPGFRGLTAHVDGRLAGFTYGFHGESGQWWHDMVAAALATRSGAGISATEYAANDTPRAWLDDSFEIAELHVLPPWQGKGIGRSLLLSLAAERQSGPRCSPPPTRPPGPGGCTAGSGSPTC